MLSTFASPTPPTRPWSLFRSLAVCRELAIRDWAVPWTCYINPKGFDRELADAMVAAGCQGMEVGTDSGCPAVLERQGKGFTLAEVRALRSVSAAAGLRDCHTFVLGTEGETVDEVRESLDFLEDLEPYAAILMLYIDEREALDPVLARAQQAFRALLGEEVRARCAQQPTWIVPQLGIGVDDRLLRLLRRQGLDGPLWQYVDRRDATPLPARPRSPLAPRPDRTRSTGT